jgi:hypothetical protein
MANVGKIAVQLTAQTSQFTKGMVGASATLTKFSKLNRQFAKSPMAFIGGGVVTGIQMVAAALAKMAKIAAAAIVSTGIAFVYLTRKAALAADDLAKKARKMGLLSEELAGLRFGAELAGSELEAFDNSLTRAINAISEAAKGTGSAQEAFKELGLDAKKLRSLGTYEAFLKIGDAIAGVANESDRVRLAIDIFGRSGSGIINLFTEGSEQLREYTAQARMLGIAMSNIDTTKIEDMNDDIFRLNSAFSGFFQQMAAHVAPFISDAADRVITLIENLGGIPAIAERAFNAFGQAADHSSNWAIESFGAFLNLLKRIEQFMLIMKATVLTMFTAPIKAITELDKLSRKFLPKSIQGAPVISDEFLGSFQNDIKETIDKAKQIEDELNSGTPIGDRFKNFAFEKKGALTDWILAVKKQKDMTEGRLSTEAAITDELEEQAKIFDSGSFGTGDLGRIAFNGADLRQPSANTAATSANDAAAGEVRKSNNILNDIRMAVQKQPSAVLA